MDSRPEVRLHDLLAGERLLWSGSPVPGFRILPGDLKNLVFGCMFTGFALFWTSAAFLMTRAGSAPWFFRVLFPLFGTPFILVGLWVLFGTPVSRTRRARSMAYAITERRLIVVSEGGSRTVNAFDLERIESTTLHEGKDGVGTISFTISGRDLERLQSRGRLSDAVNAMTLESLNDVATVFRTLESARAARRSVVGEIDP